MILYDFTDGKCECDIDLDDPSIELAELTVLSGDEVLTVIYKDGTTRIVDADTHERFHDYFDGSYILVVNGKWQVNRDGFFARKDSYDDGWARSK